MQYSCRLTYLFVVLLIIASVLPLWAAYRHHAHLNDDAYITLTYAKNLASGRGFVFNHPPSTLGTTTPLLTLLVAGLSIVLPSVGVSTLAVYLSALCWVGIVWIIFLSRHNWAISAWEAIIVGLVIIASGWISSLGMETYLFAFLLVLSLSLFHGELYLLAGFTSGLLFLTRGEGILVLIILVAIGLFSAWSKKQLRGQSRALFYTNRTLK